MNLTDPAAQRTLSTTQMLSSSFKSCIGTPAWTDEFLRQSLLAEDIIDVHFHLFSRRSKSRVLHPRMLNTNTALLKSSGKYFKDLFSSDPAPSDAMIFNVRTTDVIFDGLELDEYGYGSDSDLEDEDDGTTVKGDTDASVSLTQSSVAMGSDFDDRASHSYLTNPSNYAGNYTFPVHRNGSDASGATSSWNYQNFQLDGMSSVSDRGFHIFVKDTAFQTWYSLMYYLYTDYITFSPLKSSGQREHGRYSRTAKPRPQCSAKSMYCLATKLGIDKLRDLAFDSIRDTVNESNLLQELASSFAGRYPDVLELELDLLAQKVASTPIVEGLPHLMRRIALKELSHGADIMIGLHTRILQKHYSPQPPTPMALASDERSGSLRAAPRLARPPQGPFSATERAAPAIPASAVEEVAEYYDSVLEVAPLSSSPVEGPSIAWDRYSPMATSVQSRVKKSYA
ncbi:hypothetical protein PISMIDRAFT_679755 [Pisolithus microcarpus 441]|uniref:BTB domain-containing protein n=1 Tax=Pisolithus microcarpus 441 TaxID=765257 RepID=A0A0C9ZA98_9AGAM|nr:hypothetical protein PISMIDRAFT_679755 [Pisolithus microcarpus 441]